MELGVGVIGTGFIGGVHARAARLNGGRVVGVMASTPERSTAAARDLGAVRALASLDELAAADDIDVVHVCTPNALHAAHVRAALQAGKHVVCEKPLGTDRQQAVQLAALAAEVGRVATVPFVYRFYPTVRQARAFVARGDLGSLRLVHGSYLQDWMSNDDDWSWRVDRKVAGPSRTLADIGSHWFDLMEFVTGHRVSRLSARLHTAIPVRVEHAHRSAFTTGGDAEKGTRREVDTEDAAMVLFETDGGAAGSVVVSQISPGRKNALRVEIDGADAAVAFDQEHPDTLWMGRRQHTAVYARGEGMVDDAARLNLLPAGHPQGYLDAFTLFVADTYARIAGGDPPGLPDFTDGVRAAGLVDAALQSTRSERWVEVADPSADAVTITTEEEKP